MSSTSIRARIMRGTGWMVLGNGMQQAFAMLASIGTARSLGKAGFGEFGAVRSTTLTIAVLAGGGLGLAMTRYVATLRTTDPERAARVTRLIEAVAWVSTVVAAVLCAALARPLAVHLMHSEKLAFPLAISAITIIFSTVGGVQAGVIAGCEAFKPLAILLAIEGFATGAFTVAGAWMYGLNGAITGQIVATVIIFVLRQRQVGIEYRRANIPRVSVFASGAMRELPILFTFILPAVLLVVGTQPSEWLGRMLLMRGNDGVAELGIFTAAYSWAQIVQFVPSQIAIPAVPILTNVFATGDVRAFRKHLLEVTALVFGIAAVIAVPLALLSRFVMSFYGPAFREGSAVLSIIVLAHVIGAVSMLLRYSFLSIGRAWLQLVMTFGWGVALPVTFLFLRHRGATGLAQSYAVAFLMLTVAQAIAAWAVFRKSAAPRSRDEVAVAVDR